jgi:hypothetical protein
MPSSTWRGITGRNKRRLWSPVSLCPSARSPKPAGLGDFRRRSAPRPAVAGDDHECGQSRLARRCHRLGFARSRVTRDPLLVRPAKLATNATPTASARCHWRIEPRFPATCQIGYRHAGRWLAAWVSLGAFVKPECSCYVPPEEWGKLGKAARLSWLLKTCD